MLAGLTAERRGEKIPNMSYGTKTEEQNICSHMCEQRKNKTRFNGETTLIFRFLGRMYNRWDGMRKSLYLQGLWKINNACTHKNNGLYITGIMIFRCGMRRNDCSMRIKIKIKKLQFGHTAWYKNCHDAAVMPGIIYKIQRKTSKSPGKGRVYGV